jgi:hypothetical protein
MGLWSRILSIFRKKPKQIPFEISLDLTRNVEDIKRVMEKELLALYPHCSDEAFTLLEKVFTNALTVQLLETNMGAKELDSSHYHYVRGRLDAYSAVVNYFSLARSRETHVALRKKFEQQVETDEKVLGFKKKGGHHNG